MDSAEVDSKTVKKAISTKTGLINAGDKARRLKVNREGAASPHRGPKNAKEAIKHNYDCVKNFQKDFEGREIPLSQSDERGKKTIFFKFLI